MKKLLKSRTFVGALLSIALCVSLIAGATFAIFTSEAKVNVAVTSGTVKVTAEVTSLSLYSPKALNADGSVADEENVATETAFKNGGTAAMNNGTLRINGITPGDKVTVKLTITDNGNVSTLYRYGYKLLAADGSAYDVNALALFEGLNFEFDGRGAKQVGDTATTMTVAYKTVYAELPESKEITAVVEMPGTAGDKYQGLSLSIAFVVEAVQANIDTTGDGETVETASFAGENLNDQLTKKGTTVVITESKTIDSTATIEEGVTITGAGKEDTVVTANNMKVAKNDITIKDMTIKGRGSAETAGTLNINGGNATVENVNYEGDGNIAITVSTGATNEGTTFKSTKITNAFRGIQFWSLSGDSIIEDCVIDVAGYTFNIDAAVAGSTLTVRNSTLNGWTSYTSGIKLVSFDNCKFGRNTYEYFRPYSETKLTNCEFTSAEYLLNAGGSGAYTITLENCTKNGVAITKDNVKALLLELDGWNANATLVVNGEVVSL